MLKYRLLFISLCIIILCSFSQQTKIIKLEIKVMGLCIALILFCLSLLLWLFFDNMISASQFIVNLRSLPEYIYLGIDILKQKYWIPLINFINYIKEFIITNIIARPGSFFAFYRQRKTPDNTRFQVISAYLKCVRNNLPVILKLCIRNLFISFIGFSLVSLIILFFQFGISIPIALNFLNNFPEHIVLFIFSRLKFLNSVLSFGNFQINIGDFIIAGNGGKGNSSFSDDGWPVYLLVFCLLLISACSMSIIKDIVDAEQSIADTNKKSEKDFKDTKKDTKIEEQSLIIKKPEDDLDCLITPTVRVLDIPLNDWY